MSLMRYENSCNIVKRNGFTCKCDSDSPAMRITNYLRIYWSKFANRCDPAPVVVSNTQWFFQRMRISEKIISRAVSIYTNNSQLKRVDVGLFYRPYGYATTKKFCNNRNPCRVLKENNDGYCVQ